MHSLIDSLWNVPPAAEWLRWIQHPPNKYQNTKHNNIHIPIEHYNTKEEPTNPKVPKNDQTYPCANSFRNEVDERQKRHKFEYFRYHVKRSDYAHLTSARSRYAWSQYDCLQEQEGRYLPGSLISQSINRF